MDLEHIIPAPQWLKESNARQRMLPPPTLAKVRQQMQASAAYRAAEAAKSAQVQAPKTERANSDAEML
ncbi:MAG: hypothetical protein WCS42_22540 [Verrucomicrobiota bacterium]